MAFPILIAGASQSLSSSFLLSHLQSHNSLLQPTHQFQRYHFSILQPPSKRQSLALKSNPDNSDPNPTAANRFLDEKGVVDDMSGYLNDLSLEYDSVWDTKPSWCQPWTITLTGVLVTAASWLVLHSPPVTVVVLFVICAWWYIFLYSYPKAYSDIIAERRRNVKNGMEDTYGL